MTCSGDAFGVLTPATPTTRQCCILKDGVAAYSETPQDSERVTVYVKGGFELHILCTYRTFHAFMNSYETNRWEGLRVV